MCSKSFSFSVASFIGGALAVSTIAHAVPRDLSGLDGDGKIVSSGWTWDVSPATEPLVNLVFIRMDGNNFVFEKDAEIKNASDPIVITFNKVSPDAKQLEINDETVINNSGVNWNAFRFELSSGSTGGTPSFAFATSDGTPGIGDFSIDPFTSFQFYNQNAGLLFTDGVVAPGSTWFPGSQSTTNLAIVTNDDTATTFTLKEIAIPIPLPAAAWSGLATLAGLGVIAARRARRTA